MKKLCFLVLLCIVSSTVTADGIKYADTSSRGVLNDGTSNLADTVKADSSKLGVRGDAKAAKSWIKFDISELDVASMTECKLRITLNATKSSTCSLSAVNDDYTTGIDWADGTLTWNNGPGNYTSSDGINPDGAGLTLDNLQEDLDPAVTTLIGTVDYTGGLAGQQYFIDVLSILQADTDGIVQFVLHDSGGDTSFSTHDHPEGEAYYPALVYAEIPTGNCEGVGVAYSTYADDSCRTVLNNASDGSDPRVDSNETDSSKLTVRSDAKANKSWIKFDINDLGVDLSRVKSATLRITLNAGKSTTSELSAVNDDYTTGIDWADGTLTWNNAPGNITSSDGETPNDNVTFTVDNLRADLDTSVTTPVGTISTADRPYTGEQFEANVLSVLEADTDGILQFILHGSANYVEFSTHDHAATTVPELAAEEYWPRLDLLLTPLGADNPYPCPAAVVSSELVGMSWSNPDPNDGTSPITCTVYLGTEPNRLLMESVTLDPDVHAVFINEDNFPNANPLQNLTTYYWAVDCDDPSVGLIDGLMWDFYVNDNAPPVVDAGPAQAVWLGMSGTAGQEIIYLDGTVTDDGLPDPPAAYTVLWTQEDNGAPAVVIDPNDVVNTSVTITERGDYLFKLTADDGEVSQEGVHTGMNSDTVRIVVGTDACDASHTVSGEAYDPGDFNEDCIVNLDDFAVLIAKNWLDCTDTLDNCGN